MVAHTPTPTLVSMVAALTDGFAAVDDLDVHVVAALDATAEDLDDNDLTVLFTPANLGYISGALKHAFDRHFRTLDGRSDGHPFLAVVRGASDVTGAVRAIDSITTGLRWRAVRPAWTLEGEVTESHLSDLRELGEGMGTAVAMGAV